MSKNLTKELIIALLIILAIILVLGVLLYGYVPTNKIIPEEVSYVTPKDVKEKLQSVDGVNEDEVILTYEINQTDLYNYQRINEYKPGKTNPFSTYQTQTEEESSETNSQSGGSSSGNSSSSSTSGGSSSNQSSGTTNTSSGSTTPGTVNPGNYTNNKGLK